METKINVAEILKDKPKGTKLYDLLRNIDVELDKVHITDVGSYIECTSTNEVGSTLIVDYSKLGTEECWLDGLQILLPSREMRDWSKFAWKKGDVLVSNYSGTKVIFVDWYDDSYTSFNAKHYLDSEDETEIVYHGESSLCATERYSLEDKDAAQAYIKVIEKRLGGKLNRETLEIEPAQPEFKDGDIVRCINGTIVLIKEISFSQKVYFHAYMNNGKICFQKRKSEYYGYKDYIKRVATEEEKQQLFDALAKKGKAWDTEKKQIIDLKPKVELKPFDKVLSRRCSEDYRVLNFYSHKTDYYHVCIDGSSNLDCIPYNEETAHLLGTTDEWKGGEG